jgi:hypothetical protein
MLTRSNFALLRGSPRGYEPAKSKLFRSNRKKVIFRTFEPTVSPGVRLGRPDHEQSIVLDEGVVVIKSGDASSKG